MHPVLRCCVVFLGLWLSLPAAADSVRIVATPDVIADYHRFVGQRSPVRITLYQGEGSRRDVVELLLVQQALALGGDTRPVELVPAPTYRRMLALVAGGHADLTGSTVWGTDIEALAGQLQASRALIPDGQFVAGLFRAARATGVDARIRQRRWQELTAVSSRDWTPDWMALQRLGLAQVYDTAEWPAMVRMVDAGRADFVLAPFQGGAEREQAIRLDGITLVPAAGTCLALPGSRHIAVNRSDAGARTLAALERGLAQLQHHDTVRRAYTEAGFLVTGQSACLPPP